MPPGQAGKQNHWYSRYWGSHFATDHGDPGDLHIPVKDYGGALGSKTILVSICTYTGDLWNKV